jgi:hypothetical protein
LSSHAKKNPAALEDFLTLITGNVRRAFDIRSPAWLDAGVAELLR